MQRLISLSDLEMDKPAKISYLNCESHIKRRFLDLGIIPNTLIMPVFKSTSGDPTAYEVRDTILAIRKQDAKNIFVSL